jgi:transposase
MILYPEDPQQMFFVSRSELVAEELLVRTVGQVVDGLDLAALYDRYSEGGRAFYDPAMLLKVRFFAYCDGVRSSREVIKRIKYDLRYQYFTGSLRPDFRTVNRFRHANLDLLGGYLCSDRAAL